MMVSLVPNAHDEEFASTFAHLFDRLSKAAATKGMTDAEDMAQECLFEYSKTASDRGFTCVQEHLVHHILNRRIIDARRRLARVPVLRRMLDFKSIAVSSNLDTCSSSPAPFGRLGILSDKSLDLLRLKYVAGHSDDQIAEATGMKPNGVRTSIKRSCATLLAEASRLGAPVLLFKEAKEPQ